MPSSLVEISMEDASVIDWGNSRLPKGLSPAAIEMHHVLHQIRPEANCISHFHSAAVSAVSTFEHGFIPVDQSYHALPPITIHEYNGFFEGEALEALVNDSKEARTVLLRNHGLLLFGETIDETVVMGFYAQAAAEAQVAALSMMSYDDIILPNDTIIKSTTEQFFEYPSVWKGGWDYICRKMVRLYPNVLN